MTHNPESYSELQRDAIAHSNVLKACATPEREFADARHAVRNGDAGQTGALIERHTADVRHAFRNHNAGQAAAIAERPVTDALHAIRNGDTGQVAATVECMVADALHAVGNHNAGQAGATAERTIADARHAVRNGDAGQTGTTVERMAADALHAVGDHNAGQAGAIVERHRADSRDLLPVIDRRDFDVGVGAGSDSENSAGPVFVGHEYKTLRTFVRGGSGGKDICAKVSAVVHAVRIHAVVANAINVAKVLPAVLDESELVRLMHAVVTMPQDSRVITLCKSAKSSKEFGANLFAGAPVSVQVDIAQVDANLDCGLGHKVLKFLVHGVIPFSGGVSRRVY